MAYDWVECTWEAHMDDQQENLSDDSEVRARREFLKKCGKFAVVVPPAMTLLLTRGANAGCPAPSVEPLCITDE